MHIEVELGVCPGPGVIGAQLLSSQVDRYTVK